MSPLLSNDMLVAQNVGPKAGTPGVSVDSNAPSSGGSAAPSSGPLGGLGFPLIMMLMFVPVFFLMSRRQKKESQARASLKKGDRVMTNAGLIGELLELDDRIAKVKIAPGVNVQIVANTVSPFVEAKDKTPVKEPAKDLKEAKALSDKK